MKSSGICRFCQIADGNVKYIGVDEPFAESASYLASASIGALVEGWSLVIPKAHCLSLRSIYKEKEFKSFVQKVVAKISDVYGPVIMFEHGANKSGSITACGTDHAHLHVVPWSESLLSELHQSGLSWRKCYIDEISQLACEDEYLFYAEPSMTLDYENAMGYIHVLQCSKSQFFRKILAAQLDKLDVSDYKKFPHLEVGRHTRLGLSNLVS